MLITMATSVVLVLAGSFERLLGIGAFLYVLLPLSGLAALIHLRLDQPDLQRPFRCWGYPLTPLLVGLVSLGFLAGALIADLKNSLAATALVTSMALVTTLVDRYRPSA
jgi:APA family basic amino acid/polyamine antiporter